MAPGYKRVRRVLCLTGTMGLGEQGPSPARRRAGALPLDVVVRVTESVLDVECRV